MCTISLDAKRIIAYSKEDVTAINLPVNLGSWTLEVEPTAFPGGFVTVNFADGEWWLNGNADCIRVKYFLSDTDGSCEVRTDTLRVPHSEFSVPDEVRQLLNEFAANQVALQLA